MNRIRMYQDFQKLFNSAENWRAL